MSDSTSAPATSSVSTFRAYVASSQRRGGIVAGALLLAAVFFFGGDSWLSIIDTAMIAAIATLGLNVLSGYAGQISLGIAFFMGIGAYIASWLGGSAPIFPGDPKGLNLSIWIWLPVAGIVSALLCTAMMAAMMFAMPGGHGCHGPK